MVFSFTGVFVWSRLQKLSSTSIEIFPQNRKYIVSIAMIVKSYDAKRNQKKPLILRAAQKMALEIQHFSALCNLQGERCNKNFRSTSSKNHISFFGGRRVRSNVCGVSREENDRQEEKL